MQRRGIHACHSSWNVLSCAFRSYNMQRGQSLLGIKAPVKTNRGARECVKMPLPTAPSAFMSRNGKHTRGVCAMGRVLAFSTLTCDKSHIYKGLFFGPWPEVHCTGHHSVAAFDGGVTGMGIVQCFTLFSSFLLPNRRHQK